MEEVLYPAMEDYAIDIMIGKGPGARSVRLNLPKFTLVGATTRAGMLTAPLRDRFGVVHHLELYNEEELKTIILRSAHVLGVEIEEEGAMELARRSRGTPRLAARLLDGGLQLRLLLVELVDYGLALLLLALEGVALLAGGGQQLVLLGLGGGELLLLGAERFLLFLDDFALDADVLGVFGGVAHAAVHLPETLRHENECPLVLQQPVAVHVEHGAAVLLLTDGEVAPEGGDLLLEPDDVGTEGRDVGLHAVDKLLLLGDLGIKERQVVELRLDTLTGGVEQLLGLRDALLQGGALFLELLDALTVLRGQGKGRAAEQQEQRAERREYSDWHSCGGGVN